MTAILVVSGASSTGHHIYAASSLVGRSLVPPPVYLLSPLDRLNVPLNSYLGRKGTIALTCFVSFASCLGQAFSGTRTVIITTRLLLGIGIGPKSATIPVYAAECVPEQIRGALVVQWQMWTAFGIMLGFISGVIFEGTGVSPL
jgi:MFS family permease